jgi:hypothetical protein
MVSHPCLGQIVGGHHESAPSGRFVVDNAVYGLGRNQVESGQRLVEQQQIVLLGQTLRHKDSLPLSPGELTQMTISQIFDSHP